MAGVRVLYVIGGLARGGAEKQLYLLLKYMDRTMFTPTVVSLSAGGAWTDSIRQLGVTVIELPRRRSFEVGRFLRLYQVIRREDPVILQTFLFSDNAYGLLAGRLAGVSILIASRRIDRYGESRVALRLLNRLLGQWTDVIICNAERSRRHAPPSQTFRHVVIRNGIEPLIATRSSTDVRQSLRIPQSALVVGNIGRLVQGKNHRLFVEVAADLLQTRQDAFFLLIGKGPLEPDLKLLINRLGLGERVIMTGERGDIADLMGAMDVFLLTSDREGMSNVTMEAMSVGLPCVVTDAGGNEELVIHGETGYVCPLGNKLSFVANLCRLLDAPNLRQRFGANGRKRMETDFSAESMAKATQALYTNLLITKQRLLSSAIGMSVPEQAGEVLK